MESYADRVSCEERDHHSLDASQQENDVVPVSQQAVDAASKGSKVTEPASRPRVNPQIDVLRKRRNMTQQELAMRVGVTVTTISKWENGESGTETIRRFARLCEVLHCNIEDVINITQDEKLIPRIAELRKAQGISQRSLAQSIDATEITVANWERGRSGLDWIERLIRLCDALDCSITELVVYNTQETPVKLPPLSKIIQQRRARS